MKYSLPAPRHRDAARFTRVARRKCFSISSSAPRESHDVASPIHPAEYFNGLLTGVRGGPRNLDDLPDVRDGLTRVERVILWQLRELERERERETGQSRSIASAMLYGRVVEYVSISVPEFQRILSRLTGQGS